MRVCVSVSAGGRDICCSLGLQSEDGGGLEGGYHQPANQTEEAAKPADVSRSIATNAHVAHVQERRRASRRWAGSLCFTAFVGRATVQGSKFKGSLTRAPLETPHPISAVEHSEEGQYD